MPRFVALAVATSPDDLAWALDGFAQLARRAGYDVEPAVLILSADSRLGGDEQGNERIHRLVDEVNQRFDPVARVVMAEQCTPAVRCAQYRAANALLAPSLEPESLRIIEQYVVSRIAGFGAVVVRADDVETKLGVTVRDGGVYSCGPHPDDLARALLRAALAAPDECRSRMRVLRHELCHGIGEATTASA